MWKNNKWNFDKSSFEVYPVKENIWLVYGKVAVGKTFFINKLENSLVFDVNYETQIKKYYNEITTEKQIKYSDKKYKLIDKKNIVFIFTDKKTLDKALDYFKEVEVER